MTDREQLDAALNRVKTYRLITYNVGENDATIIADEVERLSKELNRVTRGDVSNIITTLGDALTYIASLESVIGQIQEKVAGLDTAVKAAVDEVNDINRRSPMTFREELEHGPGTWLNRRERHLRRMLAFRCSAPGTLYGDDGELTDSSMPFPIDYMRDSVEQIRGQLEKRALASLQQSPLLSSEQRAEKMRG